MEIRPVVPCQTDRQTDMTKLTVFLPICKRVQLLGRNILLFLIDSDLRRVSFVSLNAVNACNKTPYSLTLYPLMERLYYCLLLNFVPEAGSFVTLLCRSNWSPFFIRAWGITVERKDLTFRA
jgi:hypothetical protein